jgi:hypothetical protein
MVGAFVGYENPATVGAFEGFPVATAAVVGAFVGCGVGNGHTSSAVEDVVSADPCTLVILIAVALTPTRLAMRSFIGMQWS